MTLCLSLSFSSPKDRHSQPPANLPCLRDDVVEVGPHFIVTLTSAEVTSVLIEKGYLKRSHSIVIARSEGLGRGQRDVAISNVWFKPFFIVRV
jgi:hypothetical protein